MRTPSEGLKMLERLYDIYPNYQGIKNSLINAYIKLGHHDIALEMIAYISENKIDVQSLQLKAWECHIYNNKVLEKKNWNQIKKKKYIPTLDSKIKTWVARSNHKIHISKKDICLFCVERNEIIQLPFFLDHYRRLGITQFFFVDNNSTDGSLEFLLRQPDCHIWWSDDNHAEAGGGMRWINKLIDKFTVTDQWYIVADADEYLIYPGCEQKPLSVFTDYLESNHYEAVSCFMLDMFPNSYKEQISICSGDNLIQKSSYFYNNYHFYHSATASYQLVFGGIFNYFFPTNLDWLHKVLLMKKGIEPIASNHNTSPAIMSPVTSTALHFKWVGDLQEKAIIETQRKIHNGGGIRYQRYASLFEQTIDDSFRFTNLSKTTKYKNSQQLVELGLIQTTNSWEKFIQTEGRNDE